MSTHQILPQARKRSWSSPGTLETSFQPATLTITTTKSLSDLNKLNPIPEGATTTSTATTTTTITPMDFRLSSFHFEACLKPLPPSTTSSRTSSARSAQKRLPRKPSNASSTISVFPPLPKGLIPNTTPPSDLSLTKTPSPPRQRYSPLIPPEEVPQPGDPNYEPPGPLARTHDRDEDPVVKLNTERNIEILPPADADLSEPKLKGSPPRSAVAFAPIVELKDLDDSVEEAGILRPRPEGFRGRLKERLVQEIRRGRGAVTPPISGRNSPPPQHATLPTRRTRVTPAAGNSMGFWEGYRRWRELRRWRNRGPGLKVEERNRMDELEEWFSGISGKLLERFRRLARRRRRDQGSGSNDQDDEDETSEDLDTTVDATDETSEDEDQTDNQRMRRTKTSNQADDDHSGTHNL